MSKLIVCRNTKGDAPNVLRGILSKPITLAPMSKIGLSQISCNKPEKIVFTFPTKLFGLGYLNGGNSEAFELFESINTGQYSYVDFALELTNKLNNILIPYTTTYTAESRPPDFKLRGFDKYIQSDVSVEDTTMSEFSVAYDSVNKTYSFEKSTHPLMMLAANGDDVENVSNINFNPNVNGSFNIEPVIPFAPGLRFGSFDLSAPQCMGSFLQSVMIDVTTENRPVSYALQFKNNSTGQIDLSYSFMIDYSQHPKLSAVCSVNTGSEIYIQSIPDLSEIVDFNLFTFTLHFYRFAGKAGMYIFGTKALSDGCQWGFNAPIAARAWENNKYAITYSQSIYFIASANYLVENFIHSPITAVISDSPNHTLIINKNNFVEPKNIIKQQNKIFERNDKYFKQLIIEKEENDVNGIEMLPMPLAQKRSQPIRADELKTLPTYLMPGDYFRDLGFYFTVTNSDGNYAYYYESTTTLDAQTINSDISVVQSSSMSHCVILVRNLPIDGVLFDDNGFSSNHGVLDSITLQFNEAGQYVQNLRPPILQNLMNKELLTITNIEVDLMQEDGVTPIDTVSGAIVTLYIMGTTS